MVIGPVCLRKAMPQTKRRARRGRAAVVLEGQMKLALEDGSVNV